MRWTLWLAAMALWGMARAAEPSGVETDTGAVVNAEKLDFFNPAAARKPMPGEWIEYRVAFPVDPLENSLRPDPALLTQVGADAEIVDLGDGYEFFKPSFEPPAAWRVLPLRIEIREVTDDGCNTLLTFAGENYQFFMKKDGGGAEGEFYYDPPGEDGDRRLFVKVGGEEVEVDAIRRFGEGYGFVRYFSDRIPFGVFRFATDDVDLVMVGLGRGRPPDFPLAETDPIEPPLGHLYGRP